MKSASPYAWWIGALAAASGCVGGGGSSRPLPASPDAVSGSVLLAATGDIADCAYNGGADAARTADLLRGYPGSTVVVAGDLAYENGTRAEFAGCYGKHWGGLKERTRPAPGNHEYGVYLDPPRNDATSYFEYFGASAGPAGKGFYSFDLGAWHVVSLNSMAGVAKVASSAPSMTEQIQWLEADLGKTDKGCILAFWHHPLFSSGHHGHDVHDPGRAVGPLWDTLARRGADLVINGHDHDYERFALQTAGGVADDVHGIREIVAGTGGAQLHPVEAILPNSEVRLDKETDHGVLFLKLRAGSYEWRFVRTDGTYLPALPRRDLSAGSRSPRAHA